jgi:hypothetical protein
VARDLRETKDRKAWARKEKGKGKKGRHGKGRTEDGRFICFAFNGEGCASGQCNMVHVCSTCEGTHAAWDTARCPAAGGKQMQ